MAQFLSNINLSGNEIQNFVVQPLATAPTTLLKIGRKFFNTAEKREAVYDGSKWLLAAYMSDIESINDIAEDVDTRLKAIEAYFSTTEDADSAINKWNEIVAFLNATEGDTLDEILSGYVLSTRKISAGTGLTGGGTLTSDVTLSLATVGTAGTYFKTTVDAYGRVTSGSNPTTLAGFGITDAYTKEAINNLLSDITERLEDVEGATTAVSVTQAITSGIEIGSVTVDDTTVKLYAPSTYAWENISGKTAEKLIALLGYTPFDEGDFTKTNIKTALGIADWALAATKPTYTKADVGLSNVTNLAASGYLTDLSSNTTDAVSITVGGTTKSITATTMKASLGLKALAYKDSLSASDVGATRKYAGTITAGSATEYTITHSLGTRDVIVMVYDPDTYEQVMVDVVMSTTNAVKLLFASAPSVNYRVVVIG